MPALPVKPHWQTTDGRTVRLYQGDALQVLKRLPTGIVQCVVTSPPYWGLRSYLNDDHEHKQVELGGEETPEEYVERLVATFREVRKVLRNDGTVWLNLGDSYAGSSQTAGLGSLDGRGRRAERMFKKNRFGGQGRNSLAYCKEMGERQGRGAAVANLKGGNLVGIPWRVALALQADGWILRQDIIWAKASAMPESVRNRCTKSHEYVFLLTKSMRYYYDADAIKERATVIPRTRNDGERWGETKAKGGKQQAGCNGYANKRSVWRVSTEGYSGAHFACFPTKLIEPMIKAGTSEHGICAECGAPYRRVVEEKKLTRHRPNDYVKRNGEEGTGNSCANSVAGVDVRTIGWEKTCRCDGADVQPCIVLDPFIGSGTTALTALRLGRACWGVDLNADYLDRHAIPRTHGVLLATPRRNLVPLRNRPVVPLVGADIDVS